MLLVESSNTTLKEEAFVDCKINFINLFLLDWLEIMYCFLGRYLDWRKVLLVVLKRAVSLIPLLEVVSSIAHLPLIAFP